MMKAAADAVAGQSKLIAVTILTSLSDDDIWAAGFETAKDTEAHARSLAALTKSAGLDGVVCSPHDLVGIRHDLGEDRGVAQGVFREGVDPVQLNITIAAVGYYYLTNRFTGSIVFERDLMAKDALDERLRFNIDTIMRLVAV